MASRTSARIPVLEDLVDPRGKAVLVRSTLDLRLSESPDEPLGRHRANLLAATVSWLVEHGARVTVAGDPGGADPDEREYRLDAIGRTIRALMPGSDPAAISFVHCDEEPGSVESLVEAHDLFVNDTLQDSALPLASLTIPPQRLPSVAGRTLEADLHLVDRLLNDVTRPLVAVLGGDRSFVRLHGLEGLLVRADTVLLGGALALPMLQAIGRQPHHEEAGAAFIDECRRVYGMSQRIHHQILLPIDLVWSDGRGDLRLTSDTARGGSDVVDVGPHTASRFADVLRGAGTVVWTGSLGRVEDEASAAGTVAVASGLGGHGARLNVVGGDSLVTCLYRHGLHDESVDLLSSTDGAIALLKYADLPTLAVLREGR